jgi:copper resistance protein D
VVWLHILAAIAWIGGMIFISLVLVPALRKLPEGPRWELLQSVGNTAKAVGWIGIIVLLFTGFLNVLHLQIRWDSFIGRLLVLKLTLVTIVISLSALHDFFLGPLLAARQRASSSLTPSTLRLRKLIPWLARINLLLALGVIYVAVLIARS